MRTVSLSNEDVQRKITKSFVPVKLSIPYGTKKFPLDWPALKHWHWAYKFMGGPKVKGITGCVVVSPDLKLSLGSTGSAFVWEMFESTAYNADKFESMLDKSLARYQKEVEIKEDKSLSKWKRRRLLARHHSKIRRDMRREGKFHFPPRGFNKDRAVQLFKISGDLPSH